MALGKRIRFFRTRKGYKQKELGEMLGFMGKTSDVRLAQYETEARTPKPELIKQIADIFDIDPRALTVPDIDSYIGLMHTMFALEDMYGLKIGGSDGDIYLHLDQNHKEYHNLVKYFSAWQHMQSMFDANRITQEQYDEWRYKYPELDYSLFKAKVPSEKLMDFLTDELK